MKPTKGVSPNRYGTDAEDYIRDLTASPRSTLAIAIAAKFKYPEMHYMTVRRILEKLSKEGTVTKIEAGKMAIWSLK